MQPLAALTPTEVMGIDRVVFDLDDTLLTAGRLTEAAYGALFRLREGGFELVACTGRPASFAEVIVRQWPIDAAIAENGAIAFSVGASGLVTHDTASPSDRAVRRARLAEVVAELRGTFDALHLADDNHGRVTDIAFDIGEHRSVDRAVVASARRLAHARGVRTFASAIHMHLTLDAFDKATGFAALARARGMDPVRAVRSSAFVGDSSNDAPAFAAFGLTLGVANVATHRASLTVPPRFVSLAEKGAGFVEIATTLLARALNEGGDSRRGKLDSDRAQRGL